MLFEEQGSLDLRHATPLTLASGQWELALERLRKVVEEWMRENGRQGGGYTPSSRRCLPIHISNPTTAAPNITR